MHFELFRYSEFSESEIDDAQYFSVGFTLHKDATDTKEIAQGQIGLEWPSREDRERYLPDLVKRLEEAGCSVSIAKGGGNES